MRQLFHLPSYNLRAGMMVMNREETHDGPRYKQWAYLLEELPSQAKFGDPTFKVRKANPHEPGEIVRFASCAHEWVMV